MSKTATGKGRGKKGKRTVIFLPVSAASLKASSALNYWKREAILFLNKYSPNGFLFKRPGLKMLQQFLRLDEVGASHSPVRCRLNMTTEKGNKL